MVSDVTYNPELIFKKILDVNGDGVVGVAEAQLYKRRILAHLSSYQSKGKIYDDIPQLPISEEAFERPIDYVKKNSLSADNITVSHEAKKIISDSAKGIVRYVNRRFLDPDRIGEIDNSMLKNAMERMHKQGVHPSFEDIKKMLISGGFMVAEDDIKMASAYGKSLAGNNVENLRDNSKLNSVGMVPLRKTPNELGK
ncbi:MAG: hypothetical protein R3D71_06400 [Rickettsiales bacterium]